MLEIECGRCVRGEIIVFEAVSSAPSWELYFDWQSPYGLCLVGVVAEYLLTWVVCPLSTLCE